MFAYRSQTRYMFKGCLGASNGEHLIMRGSNCDVVDDRVQPPAHPSHTCDRCQFRVTADCYQQQRLVSYHARFVFDNAHLICLQQAFTSSYISKASITLGGCSVECHLDRNVLPHSYATSNYAM